MLVRWAVGVGVETLVKVYDGGFGCSFMSSMFLRGTHLEAFYPQ